MPGANNIITKRSWGVVPELGSAGAAAAAGGRTIIPSPSFSSEIPLTALSAPSHDNTTSPLEIPTSKTSPRHLPSSSTSATTSLYHTCVYIRQARLLVQGAHAIDTTRRSSLHTNKTLLLPPRCVKLYVNTPQLSAGDKHPITTATDQSADTFSSRR
jgi:hypothetical protein